MVTKKDLRTLTKAISNVGVAMDAKDDGGSWFTMRGTHIYCPEGMSKKEAGERFAIKKQAQRLRKKDEEKQRRDEYIANSERKHQQRMQEITDKIRDMKKNNPLAYMRLLARYAPKEFAKVKKRLGVDAVPGNKSNVTEANIREALLCAYSLGLSHGIENSLVSIENMKRDSAGQGDLVNTLQAAQNHIERDRSEIITVCLESFPGLYDDAMSASKSAA